MSILDDVIVLKLNKAWQPVGKCSVRQAFITMQNDDEDSGVLGMNIEYEEDDRGFPILEKPPVSIYPVKWDEWYNLPIKSYHDKVTTGGRDPIDPSKHRTIRVPTVVIATSFNKMPTTVPNASKMAIYERDGGRCQYTNRKLSKHEGNIDHVIPKSRWKEIKGEVTGCDDWGNLVLCDSRINSEKGHKLNEEVGLKLIREPSRPAALPISLRIYNSEIKHHTWSLFLG